MIRDIVISMLIAVVRKNYCGTGETLPADRSHWSGGPMFLLSIGGY